MTERGTPANFDTWHERIGGMIARNRKLLSDLEETITRDREVVATGLPSDDDEENWADISRYYRATTFISLTEKTRLEEQIRTLREIELASSETLNHMIRKAYDKGVAYAKIASIMGVSREAVRQRALKGAGDV